MRTLLVVGLLLADAALTWPASAQPVGYRAEVRVSGEAKRWPEMSLWTATVRDAAGKELYTLSKGIPYDIPFPSIAVSDVAPWSVVVSSCEGWVEFYDTTGTLVSTWAVFESRTPDYERIVKCALAGERIAFLVSEPAGRETRVFLADRGGNVSPYRNLPCATAGELWLSSNGSCLVAGCTSAGEQLEEATRVIDLRTGESWEFPLQFRWADISSDRRRYVIAGVDRIIGGDLGAATPGWEWRSREPDRAVSAVRLVGSGAVAAVDRVRIVGGRPLYAGALVMVFDEAGVVVGRKELAGDSQEPSRLIITGEEAVVTLGLISVRLPVPARLPDGR